MTTLVEVLSNSPQMCRFIRILSHKRESKAARVSSTVNTYTTLMVVWVNSRHFATLPVVFPRNNVWEASAENSIVMTRHYPDLGTASDWSYREGKLLQPIKSTTQIRAVTRHQYGISALVSQTSFRGKPLVASQNVGCFLRLTLVILKIESGNDFSFETF